jgi:hypothetical protein
MKEELHMDKEWEHIPCTIKQAFWHQLASSIPEGNNNLLPLGIYMLCKRFTYMHDVGIKAVEVDRIKGRVGLGSDFDTSFMPRQQHIRNEWTSVDQTRFRNVSLPLINLLKIGDIYFVLDGHHQPAMDTLHNQESVEAHVIEIEEDNEC